MADIEDGEAINRMSDAKPARRLSEADIRMADIGDGEAINRMSDEPARRLSDADIRMADIGDGEAINRMADDASGSPTGSGPRTRRSRLLPAGAGDRAGWSSGPRRWRGGVGPRPRAPSPRPRGVRGVPGRPGTLRG
ncbi:hypothetical protein [Methylobacterium sp. WSM2598]|uniref:hypothetical protein n=1 Tax=Methylobacterium sp. WSM2598 TaxID=398261 RepID=UPI0003A13AAB|nr:hypothetical protein [Methylobacterium sp. WSM2598]